MRQIGRTSGRLRSTTAVAAIMVAAAVLVPSMAQATMAFTSSSVTFGTPTGAVGGVQNGTPGGAVGGVESPVEAGSTLNLLIDASEAGGSLASAQASIGSNSASVSLCPMPAFPNGFSGDVCPEGISDVPLPIEVGGEGTHQLLVTVTDTEGKTAALVDQTIDVIGPPAAGTNAIVLGVAGGFPGPIGPPPHEPSDGEPPGHKEPPSSTPPACPSPMLEMQLAPRPRVYTHRGVPVLLLGRRYRFAGRLTCLHGRRPVLAPEGTPVQVLYKHRACVRRPAGCSEFTTRVHRGRLSVRLRIVDPGTIFFGYRPHDGESVQVALPVAVAHLHRGGRLPIRRRRGSMPHQGGHPSRHQGRHRRTGPHGSGGHR